jgi:uncharacterized phage-associated protein
MTEKCPTTAYAIANWFIEQAEKSNMPVTHMKLQKLIYFAYGWYYACNEKPLFDETIQAWKHGPVIANLYSRFQEFGSGPIISLLKRAVEQENGERTIEPYRLPDDPETLKPILETLDTVWRTYSPCTATQLRNITHRAGSPWSNAWHTGELNITIEPIEIFKYFVDLYDQYKAELNPTV